jgi:hypothetical protein
MTFNMSLRLVLGIILAAAGVAAVEVGALAQNLIAVALGSAVLFIGATAAAMGLIFDNWLIVKPLVADPRKRQKWRLR